MNVKDNVKKKFLEKMSDSLVNLAMMLFGHYLENKFSPMHHKLSDLLINVVKKKRNLLIILPRGFAKSTFSLLFFVIWLLIFSEKKYILLIGEGKTAIYRHFSEKLVFELENNRFIKTLGFKKGGVWKVGKDECAIEIICPSILHGKRRVRIEAVSYGTSLRGASIGENRPDMILIDDLERQKSKTAAGVESAQYREDVARWFYSEIVPIGGQPGALQIVMMGTIMHEDQLLVKLFNNPLTGTSLEFDTVKMGYLIDDGRGGYKSLWPDRHSVEELLAKKDAYFAAGQGNSFANEWLSEIQDSRNQIFTNKMFRYYSREGMTITVYKNGSKAAMAEEDYNEKFERKIDIRDMLLYGLVDPAVGEDESHCDSATAVIGVTERREWFVLDMTYGKWRGSRLWEEIFKMNKKHNLSVTGIEGVGYQKAIPDALKMMMRTNGSYFRVKGIDNDGQNKFSRIISALEWRYIQGKIFHDINAAHSPILEGQLKKISVDGAKGLVDLADVIALGGDIIKGSGNKAQPKQQQYAKGTMEYYKQLHTQQQSTALRSSVV